jgi:hypothetical protein
MPTNLDIHVNTGTPDLPLGNSGAEFTEIDVDNDIFIFSAGSDTVKDGEPIPSETQLNQAGVRITGSEITVSKYFLADNSVNLLKQIHNMGAGNYRYVLAFDFDDITASEPVLEIWDDSDLDSVDNVTLGEGTPSSSWWRGITTTSVLPGAGWTGSRLAGSSDGNFLWLNNENGALVGAGTLYCQLKLVLPSTQQDAGTANCVMAIKYAST